MESPLGEGTSFEFNDAFDPLVPRRSHRQGALSYAHRRRCDIRIRSRSLSSSDVSPTPPQRGVCCSRTPLHHPNRLRARRLIAYRGTHRCCHRRSDAANRLARAALSGLVYTSGMTVLLLVVGTPLRCPAARLSRRGDPGLVAHREPLPWNGGASRRLRPSPSTAAPTPS